MSNESSHLSVQHLRPSERRFLIAMQQLGYGRFESVQIQHGELVLDPWPTTVRSVKFGSPTPNRLPSEASEFALKNRIVEFFAQVCAVESGVIRILEIRGGLPFCMDVTDDQVIRTAGQEGVSNR
jgi:hypothetical protein